jgi:hypothetical protein
MEIIPAVTTDNGRFKAWAGKHIENDGGLIGLAAPNEYQDLETAAYHWQAPDEPLAEGSDRHTYAREALMAMGSTMSDSFAGMVHELRTEKRGLVDEITDRTKAGQSTAIIMNHPWLMNLAEVAGAVYCSFDERQASEMGRHSAMIVNKMIGWLAVGGKQGEVPAIDILRSVSDVFCTVPASTSTEEVGLTKFGECFNPLMVRPFVRKLGEGALVYVTPSGSLDEVTAGGQTTITMKRAHYNSCRLLSRHVTAALPIVMWRDPESQHRSYHIGEELLDVNKPEDIHAIMQGLARPYKQLANAGRKGPAPVLVKYGRS